MRFCRIGPKHQYRDTVAVVGIVGIPGAYGGFETLVEQLVSGSEGSFTVYCSAFAFSVRPRSFRRARLRYIWIKANGSISVIYDLVCCIHALLSGHRKLLLLGVSGVFCLPVLKKFFPGAQFVVNVDGIEWKREKWGWLARRFLRYSERVAANHADTVIADNDAIFNHILSSYGRACEVIPYGGDHAVSAREDSTTHDFLQADSESNYALSLCRIEPENNVEMILQAFSRIERKLVFIGNWQGSNFGKRLFEQYSDAPGLTLLNPIYDVDRLFKFRSRCALYVHGHSAGGTNPSLVEMMHFAKPIIAFDCEFNRSTLENLGEYFSTELDLAIKVDQGCWVKDQEKILEVAVRRYTWHEIRRQYFSLFTV